MRQLVRGVLWLLLFGCLWLPVFDDPPLHTGPYVQGVTASSAYVRVVTPGDQELGLRFREDAAQEASVVPAQTCRRHEWRLSGLLAGRRYRYEVVDGQGAVRGEGSFKTAPATDTAPVKFAVVGDSGKVPWWVWLQRSPLFHLPAAWDWLPTASDVTRIGTEIASHEPDFLLHVGDIIYPNGMQGHYSAGFFRPFAPVLCQSAAFMTLGNHDVMEDAGRQALANFRGPDGDFGDDGRNFAVVWGSLRLIVLDLNPPPGHVLDDRAADKDERVDRAAALEFLRRELTAATEPWLVVASHYPILSASRQGDQPELIRDVLPLLHDYGVDLYLSGHDHTYQRFLDQDGLSLVVSGGGGKNVYDLREHPALQVGKSEFNYCTVAVEGRRLRLEAHGIDGSLLDSIDLERLPQGLGWERIRQSSPGRAARIEALGR